MCADTPFSDHPDGLTRCPWPGTDPLYVAYHDEEWGVPEFDSRALFEKLILDGFQAGLSWITILRKRDAFRTAFANFDPEKIARFDAKAIAALMDNSRIIRNRAKIEGTVVSARAWLEIETREGFSNFLWKFFDGRPQQNGFHSRAQIPTQSAKSVALSKGLKERGFKFCGPTIVYAFCQATGMANDHLISVWYFRERFRKWTERPRLGVIEPGSWLDRSPGDSCNQEVKSNVR